MTSPEINQRFNQEDGGFKCTTNESIQPSFQLGCSNNLHFTSLWSVGFVQVIVLDTKVRVIGEAKQQSSKEEL